MSFNMEKVLLIKLLHHLAVACIVIMALFWLFQRCLVLLEFGNIWSLLCCSLPCCCWPEREYCTWVFLLGVLSGFPFSPPSDMRNFYGFCSLCFLVLLLLYYYCFWVRFWYLCHLVFFVK